MICYRPSPLRCPCPTQQNLSLPIVRLYLSRSIIFYYIDLHPQFGKYLNVDTYVLGPSETKDLYPLMNVDDIYATLYSPGSV